VEVYYSVVSGEDYSFGVDVDYSFEVEVDYSLFEVELFEVEVGSCSGSSS
jgi:hypothetical protein